jgi:hypothetical protein
VPHLQELRKESFVAFIGGKGGTCCLFLSVPVISFFPHGAEPHYRMGREASVTFFSLFLGTFLKERTGHGSIMTTYDIGSGVCALYHQTGLHFGVLRTGHLRLCHQTGFPAGVEKGSFTVHLYHQTGLPAGVEKGPFTPVSSDWTPCRD